jgi:acid phosphatase type 7
MASRLIPLIAASFVAAACGADAGTDAPAEDHHSFVAAVQKSDARVWAVGDSAGGDHARAVASLIRRNRPDKVLYLGDIYGGDSGFRTYRRLFGGMPMARSPGNHDWPRYWSAKREWYSFTAAGWRVIELNSETEKPTEQLRWLRSLIRARAGDCRIAFWHKPRFSAGPHGDAAKMDPYWRALQGHARLVVSGHDHNMQRFAPRRGLVQLVSGAGGYTHYRVNRSRAGLLFADTKHWGALRINLARGRARIAFVGTSGRVLDSQTLTCRP